MPSTPPSEFDAVLHQPIRTGIVAFLTARGEATFTELKNQLDITDGNLDSHIKKLLASGYLLKEKKQGATKRLQTVYYLSDSGHEAFEKYLTTLKQLLSL